MTRAFRWRWAGRAAAAWLVLTALSLVLPAQARAGCRHPWVKGAGLPDSVVDLALLDPGNRGLMHEPRLPEPHDTPAPCAGGACSQAPSLPASSTIPAFTRIALWGDLSAGPPPSVPPSHRFAPESHHHRPARFHTPIERPPRLSPIR